MKSISLKKVLTEYLREKQDSYVIEEILKQFPTLKELMDVTEQELTSIKGIGNIKAKQIITALQLARSFTIPEATAYHIKKPEDVYKLIEPELRYQNREYFICLLLNSKNGVISKEIISIGNLNACIVHPREVFRPAIKRSSASLICVHNHPSGNPEPSSEDIQITKRIVEAGVIVGIDVLDHIIIGLNQFTSLKERGLM